MQSEEKVRLVHRKTKALIAVAHVQGLPCVGLHRDENLLAWVLGEQIDPPDLDEGCVLRLEEAVAAMQQMG